MVAVSDTVGHASRVAFWDDVYGFKMTCMKSCVLEETSVDYINADTVMSDAAMVKVNNKYDTEQINYTNLPLVVPQNCLRIEVDSYTIFTC